MTEDSPDKEFTPFLHFEAGSIPLYRNGKYIGSESFGETDTLARCSNCKNWFCLRMGFGSYQCRECGYYYGDSTFDENFPISDLIRN